METQWLPVSLVVWITALAGVLDARQQARFVQLGTGLLFARGRRTVTSWLRGCAAGRDYKRYYTLRGHERDAVELTLLTDLHRELQHASTEGYCMTYTEYQPEASARVPLPYRNGIAASLTDASG